eukprot:6206221-Pleurochrysis_carterae.AAC.1
MQEQEAELEALWHKVRELKRKLSEVQVKHGILAANQYGEDNCNRLLEMATVSAETAPAPLPPATPPPAEEPSRKKRKQCGNAALRKLTLCLLGELNSQSASYRF